MELKEIIKKYRLSFIAFIIGCVLAGIGSILMNIVIAFVIGMMEHPSVEQIKSKIGFVIAGGFIMGFTHFFVLRLSLNFKRNMQLELRNITFSKIIKKSYYSFNLKPKETYISNLVNDINLFKEDFYSSLSSLITSISSVIAAYIILIYIDWVFAIFVLAGAFLFLFIGSLFEKPTVRLKKIISDNNESFSVEVSNTLNGVEILKLNGVENTFCDKVISEIKKLESNKQKYNFLDKFQENVFHLLGLFTRVTVLIYCVSKLIKGYDLTSMALLFHLSNPVIFSAKNIFPKINKYKAAKEIYTKITKDNNEIIEDKIGVEKFVFNNKIEVKNLSYSYDGKIIFENVSFDILKGKKYLIRGVSGVGKTTLLNILSKVYENYKGDILVDGKNLKDISLFSFNERIAFIFQNVFLFEDTIKNNICLYKDYPKTKFDEALKNAGLSDFILEKKDGSDTMLCENGKDLSGGQRQRLSIARSIIKDSAILFADEATSSLEESLGSLIENELLSLDTTLVAISHRYYKGISEKYDYVLEVKNKNVSLLPAEQYFKEEVFENK